MNDETPKAGDAFMRRYNYFCALCKCRMVWLECDRCGGDGHIDGCDAETDELDNDDGYAPCYKCDCAGGFWTCPTTTCKTFAMHRLIAPPVEIAVTVEKLKPEGQN